MSSLTTERLTWGRKLTWQAFPDDAPLERPLADQRFQTQTARMGHQNRGGKRHVVVTSDEVLSGRVGESLYLPNRLRREDRIAR